MTGTLKVRRETGFGIELRRSPFEVLVDGRPVGTVHHEQTTEITLDRGQHTLRMRKGRYSSQERTIDAADRQVVTFQCRGDRIWPTWLSRS